MTAPPLNYVSLEHSLRAILHDFLGGWFDGDPAGHVLHDSLAPVYFPEVAIATGQSPVPQPLQVNQTVARRARSAGVATLTTHDAHGLAPGRRLVVSGLGGGFDLAATAAAGTTGSTVVYACPGADVAAADVAGGLVQAGPKAEIRLVVHPGALKSWLTGEGRRQHEDSVLLDFWVRAAVRSGGETATGVALTVADLLVAVLQTPDHVLPLSERGLHDLAVRLAVEVPGGDYALRKVTGRASLWYASGVIG